MQGNIEKARREGIRWYLLLTLESAQPIGFGEAQLLMTIKTVIADATLREIKVALDYLAGKGFVALDKRGDGVWHAKLTSDGLDVAEYAVACPIGVARPERV